MEYACSPVAWYWLRMIDPASFWRMNQCSDPLIPELEVILRVATPMIQQDYLRPDVLLILPVLILLSRPVLILIALRAYIRPIHRHSIPAALPGQIKFIHSFILRWGEVSHKNQFIPGCRQFPVSLCSVNPFRRICELFNRNGPELRYQSSTHTG